MLEIFQSFTLPVSKLGESGPLDSRQGLFGRRDPGRAGFKEAIITQLGDSSSDAIGMDLLQIPAVGGRICNTVD